MAGIMEAFGFGVRSVSNTELPNIYPLNCKFDYFVKADVQGVFSKILTDCIERTQGIPEKYIPSIWDTCLESENRKGLITYLAEAMTEQTDLFLVYKNSILRRATEDEQKQIEADYKERAESKVGTYISFKNYERSEFLKIFSGMEYALLNSLNKSLNLSSAIQFKMNDMRGAVSLTDSNDTVKQAINIAKGLAAGKDVMLDGEDEITTAEIDMAPTEKAIGFLNAKKSFVLCMPLSYLTGEQTPGIGSTGEADSKAVERGLKQYWISIISPTLKSLFGISTKFRSNDFRQITSALEAVKTFSFINEKVLSLENQRLIVSTLLDVENDLKGKPVEELPSDNSETESDTEDDSSEDEDQAPGKTRVANA